MNEHMPLDAQQRKLLSAFMDGQAEAVPTWDEGESGQLCECWHLYHLIGDVLRRCRSTRARRTPPVLPIAEYSDAAADITASTVFDAGPGRRSSST